ncbi:MAG: HesB/IscA family protein [Verrucomicrobiales bacterium]
MQAAQTNEAPIQLTPAAQEHLREMLDDKGIEHGGLRVFVDSGGCSGMQYQMKIDKAEEGDETYRFGSVLLHLQPASLPFLRGCVIDYQDTLSSRGFKIFNPNAIRTCGCGTSFEPEQNDQ